MGRRVARTGRRLVPLALTQWVRRYLAAQQLGLGARITLRGALRRTAG